MSLTVEDGTGLADAEAYASVEQADTRMAALGYTTWSGMSTTEKEQALRRGALYMVQILRSLWKGSRVSSTQALDWPREDVTVEGNDIDEDVVPGDIANANIDLAYRAAHGELLPDRTGGSRLIRKKLGPMEKEYADKEGTAPSYDAVMASLQPYLISGGAQTRVIR